MFTKIDETAFHYRKVVPAPMSHIKDGEVVTERLVVTVLRNVEKLGFVFTPALVDTFWGQSKEEFITWAKEIINVLRVSKGDNFRYEPIYPNFPSQVAEASDTELYLNAFMHYFGAALGVRILPEYEKDERFPLFEETTLTKVDVSDERTIEEIFTNLLASKISLSVTDIENVKLLAETFGDKQLVQLIPTVIPNKENLATVAGALRANKAVLPVLIEKVATATDLLRVAAVFSGAHPSLAETVRFGKFSRAERRIFVQALSLLNTDALNEDLLRNKNTWKRFAEKLHTSEFQHVYPEVALAFHNLRNNVRVETFNSRVEQAVRSNNVREAVAVLSERPGEFARRLNQLLEADVSKEDQKTVVRAFANVAHKVSTPVLLQTLNYFQSRTETPSEEDVRLFFPKGVTGYGFVRPDTRDGISQKRIDKLVKVITSALVEQYAAKPSLGKVFVPGASGSHAIPFGLRSASKAFKTLGRGSRIPFDASKTLRFFIHWFDAPFYSVDLDLSASLLDENFKNVGTVAYYNLREFGGVHSGDITSAPNGASEFIDIDIKKVAQKKNVRYVAMTVHSYSGELFSDLNTSLAGFMVREDANSGEVYEPATVENVFTVDTAARITVPLIFDVQENVAYWADLAVTNDMLAGANVANTTSLSTLVKGVVTRPALSIEQLFELHVVARAEEIVTSAEEADTVLGYINGELTVPMDEILSEWM